MLKSMLIQTLRVFVEELKEGAITASRYYFPPTIQPLHLQVQEATSFISTTDLYLVPMPQPTHASRPRTIVIGTPRTSQLLRYAACTTEPRFLSASPLRTQGEKVQPSLNVNMS